MTIAMTTNLANVQATRARIAVIAPVGRAAGFSLVDALVAIVVLAIGLLGVAGLQFMSKRSNFEAIQRTTATMLAHDIIERMRANYDALDTYAGTLETAVADLGGSTIATEPSPACTSASRCTNAQQIAAHDLWEWERAIDGVAETLTVSGVTSNTGGLTQPTACLYSRVSDTATDRSGNYIVAIVWRGPTEMSDPTNPVVSVPDPYACGRGSGKYNGASGAADTHRRILFVETYINATSN